jgi:hypothetical protein
MVSAKETEPMLEVKRREVDDAPDPMPVPDPVLLNDEVDAMGLANDVSLRK